ncbi:Neutral/alkaline nonlysosomal ceramidase [Coprinellus micaceus]|uniref:Neutral ceramidase n=1 Tax=Coprinellus micaceus TaxID=71717 RepID=A0A4Y7TV05_COPMI|nr:Neutral/alkaline nonlysosomal ceramidase [Coprinellus micaceus]
MVSLSFHTSSSVPLDFVDLLQSLYNAMWNGAPHFGGVVRLNVVSCSQNGVKGQYLLGLGIGDVTGPVVETNLMGYASLDQVGTGLHMRQRSRAFIVAEPSAPNQRVVFINADIGMGDTGVRRSIIQQLSSQFPGVYSKDNVAFVATHSHAGVGGYVENLLPQITSLGYVKQTADAIVAGTVRAVQRAHANLAPGNLRLGNTTVLDANINRSPTAYLANPAAERAKYQYDVDKDMTVLRFDDANGNARGLLSFFAVHGTSLYNNNTLVSGDNKGMAAYLYENSVEPNTMPGNTSFVAGFTQSNVGDTSPNTLGPICQSPGKAWDGQPCDANQSTCGGTVQDCRGRGPGFRISDYESNRIIGELQFRGAQTVMSGPLSALRLAQRNCGLHLSSCDGLRLRWRNHVIGRSCSFHIATCLPAPRTVTAPGALDFVQGDNTTDPQNPFWEIVKGAVTPVPSSEQKRCHEPKPILLNTGAAHLPYEWAPNRVDVQMLRVGNFVMLIMPGELTTMAGRRIREAVRAKLISTGLIGSNAYVVVAGPANAYAHYVTTREEYAVQRYEGASTIFGPFTLEAYIDKYTSLVPFLGDTASGTPPSDPAPEDQTKKAISLQTGVVFDAAPIGKKFGDVLVNVNTTPYRAGDKVSAQFVGANPRNNLRLEGTFLTVDRLENGQWRTVRSDSHPSTTYQWKRVNTITGTSTVTISWTIESGTPAGTYRLSYFGDSKPFIGRISAFSGVSASFTVA